MKSTVHTAKLKLKHIDTGIRFRIMDHIDKNNDIDHQNENDSVHANVNNIDIRRIDTISHR